MKYLVIILYLNIVIYALNIEKIVYGLKHTYYTKSNTYYSIYKNKLNSNLKVYDATLYRKKMKKNEIIFPKIHLIYQRDLWSNWDNIESRNHVDIKKIIKTANNLKYTTNPYIIDIEHWNVHTLNDKIANENIDKYIKVIETFKHIRPDLKFGFYGVLPNRDYWAPISNDACKIKKWKIINKRLQRLAIHVDIICPSLYTFYDNKNDWKKYALENIKLAKQYNKPIYAFIWPQYHRSNKLLGGKYIKQDFWIEQLNILKDLTGIVIWGGWDSSLPTDKHLIWDDNKQWWKTTKQFIIENSLNQ